MKTQNEIAQVLERMLPVGSIVEWAPVEGDNTDLSTPEKVAAYYGFGTWEAYGSGRMPLGASSAYPLGSEGGEATVKLTEAQLPNIFGSIYAGAGAYGADAGGFGAFRGGIWRIFYRYGNAKRPTEGCTAVAERHGWQSMVFCQHELWRESSARKPATLSRGVHLASHGLIPERGCAGC